MFCPYLFCHELCAESFADTHNATSTTAMCRGHDNAECRACEVCYVSYSTTV